MSTSRSNVYFVLALIGFIVPWIYNLKHFVASGTIMLVPFLKMALANDVTTAITLDVYVAAVVFSVWVFVEYQRVRVARPCFYVLLAFLVGLSFAFPLFLAMRERALVSLNNLIEKS